MKKILELGVDSIPSDRPDLFAEVIAEQGKTGKKSWFRIDAGLKRKRDRFTGYGGTPRLRR